MEPTPSLSITEASGSEAGSAAESGPPKVDQQYLSARQHVPKAKEQTRNHWPFCVQNFAPVVLSQAEAVKEMIHLEKSFSKQTSARILARWKGETPQVREMVLEDKHSHQFREFWKKSSFLSCFVNRFIMGPTIAEKDVPKDKKRLRITGTTFRWLLTLLDASPSFVSSISSTDAPYGFCSRTLKDHEGAEIYTCWYTLPIRTATECSLEEGGHALSAAGSNQMDPSSYLHLGNAGIDLRSSRIGIYCRYDAKTTIMLCMDFQDGRWYEMAEEPYNRLKEIIGHSSATEEVLDPIDIHAPLFSSSARWWTQVISHLKRQLAHYETQLLEESMTSIADAGLDAETAARHLTVKKSLHAIISHIERYKIELGISRDIVLALCSQSKQIRSIKTAVSGSESGQASFASGHLSSLKTHFSGLQSCVEELERKTETILDLLTQVVKWRNDMLLVSYGNSTRKLLKSARAQAKASQGMMRESHRMARDTRMDSVSMKAIAILTMAFLPATSFAAALAMPFFAQVTWLDDPAKAWIWVILTAPTTVICFLVYRFYTKKELKLLRKSEESHEEDELESLDFELEG